MPCRGSCCSSAIYSFARDISGSTGAKRIAAFTTSSLFLICYLVYHAQVGSVRFTRQGFVRPLYFTILITHVTLATVVLAAQPSVTLTRGLEGAVPEPPGDRPLDAADLALRIGHRRAGVRAVVPADLAPLIQLY